MWRWHPESSEAVGTVAAAFIAVVALLNGLHDRQTDRKDARALLANQVSVALLVDRERSDPLDRGHVVQPLVLSVTNRGPHSIYRATITSEARAGYFKVAPQFAEIFAYSPDSCVYATSERGPKVRWGILFEGKKTTIGPGETAFFHFGTKDRDPHVSVSFRDENERGWVKYPSGALVQSRRGPATNRIVT